MVGLGGLGVLLAWITFVTLTQSASALLKVPVVFDQFQVDIIMTVDMKNHDEKAPKPAPIKMHGAFDFINSRARHEWEANGQKTIQIITDKHIYDDTPRGKSCFIIEDGVSRFQTMKDMWLRDPKSYVGTVALEDGVLAHVWDSDKLPKQLDAHSAHDLYYTEVKTNYPLLKVTTMAQGSSQSKFQNFQTSVDSSLFDLPEGIECKPVPTPAETQVYQRKMMRAGFWYRLNHRAEQERQKAKESRNGPDYGTLRGGDEDEDDSEEELDEEAFYNEKEDL